MKFSQTQLIFHYFSKYKYFTLEDCERTKMINAYPPVINIKGGIIYPMKRIVIFFLLFYSKK